MAEAKKIGFLDALGNFDANQLKKQEKKEKKKRKLPPAITNFTNAKILLVVDFQLDWFMIFRGMRLSDGTPIKVMQTTWGNFSIESGPERKCTITAKPESTFPSQNKERTFSPDFVLIRNFPNDIRGKDYKNELLALMFSQLPSVNSLESIYLCSERPLLYAKCAAAGIPMVPMCFMTNREKLSGDSLPMNYPLVIKVGTAHAGLGKIRVHSAEDFEDVNSLIQMGTDYFTIEPFLDIDYEYRAQMLGKGNYRCFKRSSRSCWKNNWGDITFEDMNVGEDDIKWMEAASEIFGGMEILALDVVVLKDERKLILELNDTAIGLMFKHQEDDAHLIKEVVVNKMNAHFISTEEVVPAER